MSRVVVIGGGVIGCAAAERLTLDHHEVTLFERDQLGAHASGAAAGELSPSVLDSDNQALAMFPEVVARIEKDSSLNVEYRTQQGLRPAFTPQEAELLKAGDGRWLDASECRQTEPALSSDVLGALLLEHAHLTPPRFVRALARAAAVRGAAIREGTPAIGFAIEDHQVRGSPRRGRRSTPIGSSSPRALGHAKSHPPRVSTSMSARSAANLSRWIRDPQCSGAASSGLTVTWCPRATARSSREAPRKTRDSMTGRRSRASRRS